MEETKRLLICNVRNDPTNLFLLYRKLASTTYDAIGLFIAGGGTQRCIVNQDLLKLFPKLAYLGPTMIYDDYVLTANFPHDIDLEDYNLNMINIHIPNHLKNYHIDEIFPAQPTQNNHSLQVTPEIFQEGANILKDGVFNLGINLIDTVYDPGGSLLGELSIILEAIKKKVDVPVIPHIFGLVPTELSSDYVKAVTDQFLSEYQTVDCTEMSYEKQLGVLCNLNLLISGCYTWGYLTYVSKTPTIMIYPFYLADYKGQTTHEDEGTGTFIEFLDDEVPLLIDEALEALL